MRITFSLLTLLFIALPFTHAQAMTCESLMAEFRQVPVSRADLQEIQAKALEKAEAGQEEAHNKYRQEVIELYDAEIAMVETRIEDLKAAFKEEFSIRERGNFFSGARLVIAQEISNMELDIREMKRERKAVFKLIPRPNILMRAVGALAGAFRTGGQSFTDSLNPQASREDSFLSPLNPAGPNYQFPNTLTDGDDEDPK